MEETQLFRLQNQSQFEQNELKQLKAYTKQLEAKLQQRAASNFVASLQEEQRPVSDYPEYEELSAANSELSAHILQQEQYICDLKQQLAFEQAKLNEQTQQLESMKESMKKLLSTSKALNEQNEALRAENDVLEEEMQRQELDRADADALERAFSMVEEQLEAENERLSDKIAEQQEQLSKCEQSSEFSLDEEKAAAQQALLWQQNYETLLTEFKNEQKMEKSVKFDDITKILSPQRSNELGQLEREQHIVNAQITKQRIQLIKAGKQPQGGGGGEAQQRGEREDVRGGSDEGRDDSSDYEELPPEIDFEEELPKTGQQNDLSLEQLAQSAQKDVSVTQICDDLGVTRAATLESEIALMEQSLGDLEKVKQQLKK